MIDFTTLNFGNYSTTEANTGFTWIDGSPIYKKSFQNTFSGNTNTIDVSSLNIDILIDWRNTSIASTGQTVFGFRVGGNGDFGYLHMGTQFNKNPDELKFEFGSNFQGDKTVYTTIWYTKTS